MRDKRVFLINFALLLIFITLCSYDLIQTKRILGSVKEKVGSWYEINTIVQLRFLIEASLVNFGIFVGNFIIVNLRKNQGKYANDYYLCAFIMPLIGFGLCVAGVNAR